MSLVIRLASVGKRGERKYHIVVSEKRSRRNGRPIDTLGYYEKYIGGKMDKTVDQDKVNKWIAQGAQLSVGAKKVLESK